ncbi:SEC-C metal-binding domain-containing protein [Siminovitchia sediminis]|uniref:SEC-C metal-binding domain-containing protein n=1 Tax=Siminovitchia sediminis TaxID=1274353 RepID=A0ABW4KM99_9BACI
MNVERNHPCPCGSGKKYKRCCMNNNIISFGQMINRELNVLREELMHDFDSNHPERFFKTLDRMTFTLHLDDLPEEDHKLASVFLIMWMIFHEDFGSKAAAEWFIEKKRGEVRPAAFSLLKKWAGTPPSLSRVVRLIDAEWLEVEDYFTGQKKKVKLDEEWPELEEGNYLLGFLLPYSSFETYLLTFLDFSEEMAGYFDLHVKKAFENSKFEDHREFMIEIFPSLIKAFFKDEPEMIWTDPLYKDVAEIFEEVFVDLEGEAETLADLSVTLWNTYCLQKEPRLRKPDVYAAGLHYFMSQNFPLHNDYTQNELAEMYEVSVSSIRKALGKMEDPLHSILEIGQEFAERLAAEKEIPFHPGLMEKEMAALTKVLEEQNFASDEERNAFVSELINSGGPDTIDESEKDQAQNLVYEATMASSGRKRRELAEQALNIDKTCVDAYIILGEETPNIKEALHYFERGMLIGEKELGADFFEEMKGHFWGFVETRPFMRAKYNYAAALELTDELEEAKKQYEEILELNEQDNLGVRYQLFNLYIELEEYQNACSILKKYEEFGIASWSYNELLLEYLLNGPSGNLKELYERAKKTNRHVVDYLTGKKRLPSSAPINYSNGSKEEAQIYVIESGYLWPDNLIEWMNGED